MTDQIPQIVLDQLDETLASKTLLALAKAGDSLFYLLAEADDEIGGQSVVETDGRMARLVCAGTTVFPLKNVPQPVAEAFSVQAVAGPKSLEAGAALAAGHTILSQSDLNAKVFQLAQTANGTLDTDVNGTAHGALACAWAVNHVVTDALGRAIGGGLSTDAMFEILTRDHIEISEAEATPGTIIISPTQGNRHGHVGIVGAKEGAAPETARIYSNSSKRHTFWHSFTIGSWIEYFNGLRLKVYFFQLDPEKFPQAGMAAAALVSWKPPGQNVIVDIYAGDAKDPDFDAIKAAGVVGFIHKATDPIYHFNASLYNKRRDAAKRERLLWGSYHFGRAGDGASQAEDYLKAISPTEDEFICLDFEVDAKRPDTAMSLVQAEAFVAHIQQKLGKPPFLYGGAHLRESLQTAASSPLTVCPLWFADYRKRPTPQIPGLWKAWSLWQWAGDIKAGKSNSIPTLDACDRSSFNGTLAELTAAWRCKPPILAAAAQPQRAAFELRAAAAVPESLQLHSTAPNGDQNQITLQKSGSDQGTIAIKTWSAGQSPQSSQPSRDVSISLTSIKVTPDGKSLTCTGHYMGLTPDIACTVSDKQGAAPASVRVEVKNTPFGLGDGTKDYPLDESDYQNLTAFLKTIFRPSMAATGPSMASVIFNTAQVPTIALVNKATIPLGVDWSALLAALDKFANHIFAPIWGTPAKIIDAGTGPIPANSWALVFVDDVQSPDYLGIHELTPDGLPLSTIFVQTAISSGHKVSVTAAHELAEMLVDPGVQMSARKADDTAFYAYETADPVQFEEFDLDGIAMTNFVFPAWFEGFRLANSTRFDYLNHCSNPFELRPGGYVSVFRNGGWTQDFGSMQAQAAFGLQEHPRTSLRSNNIRRHSVSGKITQVA